MATLGHGETRRGVLREYCFHFFLRWNCCYRTSESPVRCLRLL